MAVQTSYDLYTRDAVVGALYGISLTNSVRHSLTNVDTVEIPFGVAVKNVAGLGNERQCTLGGAAKVEGFAIRQINKQMQTVPGTGAIGYKVGDTVGVLKEGFMNVLLEAGSAAAVKGAQAWVSTTDGTVRADTAANYVQATNVTFESTGSAGDIVVVNITIGNQA